MLSQAAPKKSLGHKIGIGVLLYVGTVIALVIVATLAADIFRESAAPEQEFLSGLSERDRSRSVATGELIPQGAPALGPQDARVTIVEFGDFQCPFCRQSSSVMRQLLERYPDDVRLVYRHMPLRSIHPLAEDLAHASMCAHEQGKFWSFHDRLFQQQDSLRADNIHTHALAVGLDIRQFQSCQDSGRWRDYVQKDLADAIARGGRGTPTWIVNGELLQGSLPLQTWVQIVEAVLRQ